MLRRSFLSGLSATPLIAMPLPAIAASSRVMASPLFDHIHDDIAHALRVEYAKAKDARLVGRMNCNIRTMRPSRPVLDAIHAENILFSMAGNRDTVSRTDGYGDFWKHFAIEDVMPNLVIRGSNIIAQRSRRGAGNHVFLHPDNLPLLTKHSMFFTPYEEKLCIGRWDIVGAYSSMTFYTSESAPKDAIYVAYKGGAIDGPGYLIRSSGMLGLAVLENEETAMATTTDYIQKIIITD